MAHLPKLQVTKREDGLTIITQQLPEAATDRVTINLVVHYGYAHDIFGISGQAHCLEHLLYKGTLSKSEAQICSIADQYCLQDDRAITELFYTQHYATSLAKHSTIILDYLCDIFQNPTIPSLELRREKGTIKQEIDEYEYDACTFADQIVRQLLYSKNHPLRLSPLGTLKSLAKIDRKRLQDIKRTWYVPSNACIIAAGRVNHQEVVEQVNEIILSNAQRVPLLQWPHDEWQEPLSCHYIEKLRPKGSYAAVCMGVKIPALLQLSLKECCALEILCNMFGNNYTSLLITELRTKRGLVYNVSTKCEGSTRLANYYNFYTETKPEKLHRVAQIMRKVIVEEPLSLEHFRQVRNYRCDYHLGLEEGSAEWSEALVKCVINNQDPRDLHTMRRERIATLTSLKLKDIREVRERYFNKDTLASVILKPR